LRSKADLAAFLRCLRTRRGLYFLGAGASAGEAPFGRDFARAPLIYFRRNYRDIGTTPPKHTPLGLRLLAAGSDITSADIHGYDVRPGTEDVAQEVLRMAPANVFRSLLMNQLAGPRYRRRASHNYLLFRHSPAALFMNYNHDGLATDTFGDIHPVIPVHEYVDHWIGSPEALEIIRTFCMDYDQPIASDGLCMLEPEAYLDRNLERRLMPMLSFRPEFVAIIGYSFAWTGEHHDDIVSLDCFVDRYRKFKDPVFVVDPQPWRLQEYLAERLHLANVIGVPARWNLLAHGVLEALAGRLNGRPLNEYCDELLDSGHEWSAFPL
jgi:hypothetical protein